MSLLTLEAKLERQESTTPWGFRMQGGKDFSSPLAIARVTPGSLAAKCGLQQGDLILKIGNKASEILKHKDAQDAIISYGNKLDLLLQRGGAPTYETFSTPVISSYQSPASTPGSGSSTYNTAPKPFGSSAVTSKPSPTPYSSNAEINLSQQTQNLNISAPSYSKYADVEEKPTQSTQSRSFKFLRDTLESGQGPPTQSQAPPPWASEQQAPPPPAPVQNRAPTAPKPGVWSPGQPAGGAPTAKPFVPTVPPPAPVSAPVPAAPRVPPAKPSGVGAMRGKIGDAVIKSDSTRVPICASCGTSIRGPFVTAMGKCWCPDCFICANPKCGIKLIDIGFVEEGGFLYCEKDYGLYFAPHCAKCSGAIVGECVNALNKQYHPGCFLCHHCGEPIGGNQFHLEDGHPYCETHWRQMFQTMCNGCDFPIEPGDKWVEALNQNYHSECFNCSTCQVNLEGLAFYAKGGKPFCKKHAR